MDISKSLENILHLQAQRKFIGLTKEFLVLLEERHKYIEELEGVLVKMGIDKYKQKKFDYSKDRGVVLSKANDNIRDYQGLLESFEYKIKG